VTILLEIAVVAAIVFALVAFVLGQFEGLRPAPPESGAVGIPDGPVEATAIDRTRFGLSFRGYRMDEVDAVLDRLRDELARRDEPAIPIVPQHEPGADEAPAGDLEGPWPS
jgi:DivIVA domain-containing protein